jgi:hypothetical protein
LNAAAKVSTILLLFILRENGNRRDFLSFLGLKMKKNDLRQLATALETEVDDKVVNSLWHFFTTTKIGTKQYSSETK